MWELNFWKNWPSPYRQLYLSLLLFFGVSIVFFLVAYLLGVDQILDWQVYGRMERVSVPIDSFGLGAFNLSVFADNFLIFEWFGASGININTGLTYFYLAVVALMATLVVSIIPSLSRFSYFFGVIAFVAFLVNFKLELLMVFGKADRTMLIISFILYLPTTYYFHAIRPDVGLMKRFAVFFGITIVLAMVIAVFAEVSHPFLYLSAYGMVGPLLVVFVFILVVSHEVMAGFVQVITRSNNQFSKHSLRHFLVISGVYLLGLTMLYLNEISVIGFDLTYLNLFILMIVSSILGVWGFKDREGQYENMIGFKPEGAMLYLALGVICFATMGYFWSVSNDPLLEVLKDAILYAHLGYGIIFLVYALVNFSGPFAENMQVIKVLYKPNYMPYFTFQLAGLIAVTALVMRANFDIPLYQSISGYYNGLGDLYTVTGEGLLAESYYKNGSNFSFRNHRSNYALATIAMEKGDLRSAVNYYDKAIKRRPTEQAYINLSNAYLGVGKTFEALFILTDGLEVFPKSAIIKNNLGLLYAKVSEPDSANWQLAEAYEDKVARKNAGTNIMGLAAKERDYLFVDSLLQNFGVENYWAAFANGAAISNIAGQPLEARMDYINDSTLNYLTFASLYNGALNGLLGGDKPSVAALRAYANHKTNAAFKSQLSFAAAMSDYGNGEMNAAFRAMDYVASASQDLSGYYYNIMGLWALEQGSPRLAKGFFEKAKNNNVYEASLNEAIALSETGDFQSAIDLWVSLEGIEDTNRQRLKKDMLALYGQGKIDSVLKQDDATQYHYWRYVVGKQDKELNDRFIASLDGDDYKARVALDLVRYYLDRGDEAMTDRYYAIYKVQKISDSKLKQEGIDLGLTVLASKKQYDQWQGALSGKDCGQGGCWLNKVHLEALMAEQKGDTARAGKLFDKLAATNSFYAFGVIDAASFFDKQEPIKAYDILIEAIEINPYSILLQKAYVMQCAKMDLDSYAEYILQRLQQQLSTSEFNELLKSYQQRLSENRDDTF